MFFLKIVFEIRRDRQRKMGIKGLVKNEKDGSVYIEAEGDETTLPMFLEWCNEGPDKSTVENVALADGEVKNYRNFEVVKKQQVSSIEQQVARL